MRAARVVGLAGRAGIPVVLLAAGLTAPFTAASSDAAPSRHHARRGLSLIRHVVVIMQENRSFDSYFGTFPGADGIPRNHGVPTVCLPSRDGRCVGPYHDHHDLNRGGPHNHRAHQAAVHGGRMDGFVLAAQAKLHRTGTDVMGYHDAREIPNYWRWARAFVLQDRMFEPSSAWSLPEHFYLVSGWAARCGSASDPMSCVSDPFGVVRHGDPAAWTDLTYLLHRHHVSWRYYVKRGRAPDCANDDEQNCRFRAQDPHTLSFWNPLPRFTTVRRDHQLDNIQTTRHLFASLRRGRLAKVVWVVPGWNVSEHPRASIRRGQAFVTGVIDAIMRSPVWRSTAIFLSWDDWGGFYDHVRPPRVVAGGYGLRVPGLVISPYAKRGFIDHQRLSHDAYVKFIEDAFLGGRRLDPRTDGRPDPRPVVRETIPGLGDLRRDFDFGQRPRRPVILPGRPRRHGALGGLR
jgi:phospholipase C